MYVISLPALRRRLAPLFRALVLAAAVLLALLWLYRLFAPVLPVMDATPAAPPVTAEASPTVQVVGFLAPKITS